MRTSAFFVSNASTLLFQHVFVCGVLHFGFELLFDFVGKSFRSEFLPEQFAVLAVIDVRGGFDLCVARKPLDVVAPAVFFERNVDLFRLAARARRASFFCLCVRKYFLRRLVFRVALFTLPFRAALCRRIPAIGIRRASRRMTATRYAGAKKRLGESPNRSLLI